MLSEPSKAFLQQHKEVERGLHADSCAYVTCADGLHKRTIFPGCQVGECTSRDCCIPYKDLSRYVLLATILICCFIYGTWKLENKRRKHGSIRSWLKIGPIAWIEYTLGSLLFAWYRLSIWLKNSTDRIFRRGSKTTTTTTQAYQSGEVPEHIDTTRMCEADNNDPHVAASLSLPTAAAAAVNGVNEKENKFSISASCPVLHQSAGGKQRGGYIAQEDTDTTGDDVSSTPTRAPGSQALQSSPSIGNVICNDDGIDDDDDDRSPHVYNDDDVDEGAASGVVIGSSAFKCGVNIQDKKDANLEGNSSCVAPHSPGHSAVEIECNDEHIATRMEADRSKTSKVEVVITSDDEKTTIAAA